MTQTAPAGAQERTPGGQALAHGVLVGYDGSPTAQAALGWAAGEAARRGSTLTVLSAADWFASAGAATAVPGLADDTEAVARRLVEDGVQRAREALDREEGTDEDAGGVLPEVRALPVLTDATTALVAFSRTAELVVLGNRGRGALAGALLGSVAFSVTAGAHCPVVVVRADEPPPPPGPGAPVVVGVDGSTGAARAVASAAAAAARSCALLRVVAAWTTPSVLDAGSAVAAYQQVVDAAEDEARSAAADGAQEARSAFGDLDVEEVVVQQRARTALADASRGAGLVVVGARGRGSVPGLFLGSVSHAVIHSASCPVAVVRPRSA